MSRAATCWPAPPPGAAGRRARRASSTRHAGRRWRDRPPRSASCGSSRADERGRARPLASGRSATFPAPGRLARVGLPARLVDAGLVTSLLLRGGVPGGTAAAAEAVRGLGERPARLYHGRVIATGGWVVLHYLFFYAMNDWRSTFDGANDHEADWEQASSSSRSSTTARRGPPGSAPRRTTRRATTCAADGTTRC